MKNLFIKNPTAEHVELMVLGKSANDTFTDNGPAGAIAVEGTNLSMCFAPATADAEKTIGTYQTQEFGINDKVVVEVDGELVPYVFDAADLPHFFDGVNPDAKNVQFDIVGVWFWQDGRREFRVTGPIVNSQTIDPDFNHDNLTPEQEAEIASRSDLYITDGVTSIEAYTFTGWSGLTSVTIESGDIGEMAFAGLSLNSVEIRNKTRYIGKQAFAGNSSPTATLSLGRGVETIDDMAFNAWSGGSRIDLPDTIKSLGQSAFGAWSKLNYIDLGGLEVIGSNRPFIANGTDIENPMTINLGRKLRTIGDEAFGYMTAGLRIIMSPVLETIGVNAFNGWGSALEVAGKLSLPTSVTSIGETAFIDANFTEITIAGNSTLVIGEGAFRNGTAAKVTIGQASLLSQFAFMDNHNLVDLNLGKGIDTMLGLGFGFCSALTNVHIPAGTRKAIGGVFTVCNSIETFTIAEGLVQVGSETSNAGFFDGTNAPISTLVYPNSVKDFYGENFSAIQDLRQVYLGTGITRLNELYFNGGGIKDIFIMAKAGADVKLPAGLPPTVAVYANDLAGFAITAQPNQLEVLTYTPVPPVAAIPVIAPLAPLATELTPNWSIQYRDLYDGEVKQLALGDTIKVNDIPSGSMIDEVLINGRVKTILPNALNFASIKRFRAMEGLENVGGDLCIGQQYLREAIFPSTLKRVGSGFIIPPALRNVEMPADGYLSIDVSQFDPWPENLTHPTVSVAVPSVTGAVMTARSLTGNVLQPGLTVSVDGFVGWGVSDVNGDFEITYEEDTLVNGANINVLVTDVVKNSTTTPLTVTIA